MLTPIDPPQVLDPCLPPLSRRGLPAAAPRLAVEGGGVLVEVVPAEGDKLPGVDRVPVVDLFLSSARAASVLPAGEFKFFFSSRPRKEDLAGGDDEERVPSFPLVGGGKSTWIAGRFFRSSEAVPPRS